VPGLFLLYPLKKGCSFAGVEASCDWRTGHSYAHSLNGRKEMKASSSILVGAVFSMGLGAFLAPAQVQKDGNPQAPRPPALILDANPQPPRPRLFADGNPQPPNPPAETPVADGNPQPPNPPAETPVADGNPQPPNPPAETLVAHGNPKQSRPPIA
jgi:hypothetical protein